MPNTKLHIDDNSTIQKFQKEFSSFFPFLKIEFFRKSHGKQQGSAKKEMFDATKRLADCRQQHNQGDLFVSGNMTVSELERMLEIGYGLHTQIFRKSGKLWLETTATDNWTLSYQNEQGRELQNTQRTNTMDESDYHEQE